MPHIRLLALLLLASSETLVVQWIRLATAGIPLSIVETIVWLGGLGVGNLLTMVLLMRLSRALRGAFVLSRLWMLGSLGALISGPLLAACFVVIGGVAWLTQGLGEAAAALGDTALVASGGVALALGFGSILWGWLVGQRRVEVERIELGMRDLAPALSGIRVAHITDLHIGQQLRAPQLRGFVDRVNELEAELIVITGDIFDFDPAFIDEGCRELARLRASHGVFAVLGNHDIYTGADAVAQGLARFTSIRLLRDEWVRLEIEGRSLAIAGLEDPGYGWREKHSESPVLERFAKQIPPGLARLLLIHRPAYFAQAARLGFPVSLAGHTHGGQISLPAPAQHHNVSRLISHWTRGLFRDEADQALLYVSRGLGIAGPPVRLNCPREIALHRLIERRR